MANAKHTHKLRRHTHKTGNQIYFCALPDCSFKVATALALGKRCICWRCGEEFIMNEYAIRLAKPHCEKCHNPKIPVEVIVQSDPLFIEQNPPDGDSSKTLSLADRLAVITGKNLAEEEDEDI